MTRPLTNNGTFSWAGGNLLTYTGTFTNNGTLSVTATTSRDFVGGLSTLLVNNGLVTKSA
jgi:hypothetical protein